MTKSPVKDTDQYVSNLSNNLGKFTTFKKISESRLRGFSKMPQPPWKWDGDDMYGTCCDDKNNKRHILSMPDKESKKIIASLIINNKTELICRDCFILYKK